MRRPYITQSMESKNEKLLKVDGAGRVWTPREVREGKGVRERGSGDKMEHTTGLLREDRLENATKHPYQLTIYEASISFFRLTPSPPGCHRYFETIDGDDADAGRWDGADGFLYDNTGL